MEGESGDIGIIGGVWVLQKKIGAGSFGEIYLALNTATNEVVAVKLEDATGKHSTLMYEAKVIHQIQGGIGIANLQYSGTQGDRNILVMDLLGPSLRDLFERCQHKFTVKTVMMIAYQILYRLQHLHSRGFIHRDIKPENFLIGRDQQSNIIYMIDFGLSKRFLSAETRRHIPYREKRGLVGTARYASINAHCGLEQSRRDDVEALGYVLIYFARGGLPWQGVQGNSRQEISQRITECKKNMSVESLCEGCPAVLMSYLKYCRALRFEDRPDYSYLRRMVKLQGLHDEVGNDYEFDWCLPKCTKRREAAQPCSLPMAASRSGASTNGQAGGPAGGPAAAPAQGSGAGRFWLSRRLSSALACVGMSSIRKRGPQQQQQQLELEQQELWPEQAPDMLLQASSGS